MKTIVQPDPLGRPLLLVSTQNAALRAKLAAARDFFFETTYTGQAGEPRAWDVFMSDTSEARAAEIRGWAAGRRA